MHYEQLEMFEQEYDSKEELWFSYYVSELLERGWLKAATYQPSSFTLAEDRFMHAYVEKKNSNELVEVKLTRGSVYTADWRLVWSEKAKGVFCWLEGGVYKVGFYPYRKARADNHIPFFAVYIDEELTSYVDVKGGFSNAHGLATFSALQKWLMSKDVFIQKVVVSLDPKGIFAKTFTPRRVVIDEVYKRDCRYGKEGETKLKYEPKLIEQFTKKHDKR